MSRKKRAGMVLERDMLALSLIKITTKITTKVTALKKRRKKGKRQIYEKNSSIQI